MRVTGWKLLCPGRVLRHSPRVSPSLMNKGTLLVKPFVELFVEGSSIQASRSKLSHIRKVLSSACTPLSESAASSCVNNESCSQPQNARIPRYRSFGGMTNSLSDAQQRKASLPIRWTFGGSQMSTRATQYAKVELQMAVMSVHMRSTSVSRLQFSHAFGPVKWKSGGRRRLSMPAPQKLPSGEGPRLVITGHGKSD